MDKTNLATLNSDIRGVNYDENNKILSVLDYNNGLFFFKVVSGDQLEQNQLLFYIPFTNVNSENTLLN